MSTIAQRLSCWISSSNPESDDLTAAPQALIEALEPRLLLSGDTGIDIEKFVYIEPAPIEAEIVSADYTEGYGFDADVPADALKIPIGDTAV